VVFGAVTHTANTMSSSGAAVGHQADGREGLSPSPGAPSPGVVTIADLLGEDDDDIEFEPSTERSETSYENWTEDEEEGGDEYVGRY
jgi:hypothetical protein